MELNPQIKEVLQLHKIDVNLGTLALLAIYYKLDGEGVIPEHIQKAINLTGIVTKSYKTHSLNWNLPLFKGQETDWAWVVDWNNKWKLNPARKSANIDATTRMKEFMKKYPEVKKDDIMKATDNYIKSLGSPQYLMMSAKFIFDGAGSSKKSTLLAWCERLGESSTNFLDNRTASQILS